MKVMTQLGSAAEITKSTVPNSFQVDPPLEKVVRNGIEYCAWERPFADEVLTECPG